MKIKVKLFGGSTPLKLIIQGDWIDLAAREDVVIPDKYTLTRIPLGVAMELPKGYEVIVAPRSSTAMKHGIILANSIGIIDNEYNGNNDEKFFENINELLCNEYTLTTCNDRKRNTDSTIPHTTFAKSHCMAEVEVVVRQQDRV